MCKRDQTRLIGKGSTDKQARYIYINNHTNSAIYKVQHHILARITRADIENNTPCAGQ